jgi:hypothetical protein
MIYGFHSDGTECHSQHCALPHVPINEGMDLTRRPAEGVLPPPLNRPRREEYEGRWPVNEMERAVRRADVLAPLSAEEARQRASNRAAALHSIVEGETVGQWRAREAERIAQAFHETYERLAPEHGYQTRKESAKPWAEVPPENAGLMVAVCMELLERGVISA